ncbi:quinolinate synthase NadA [Echinicola jeungdonensis]|uniref:Quinolinate synthase n=1 Tax=Echinicola jeungdonensis TaxID=709343 RepID=A0ABV5J330_9BACT|nr:quinolinate synthase NadA [Echinicola jeungdonensis]MDN3670679.1 quinolinate synthase NadA [Echinicola jeungdonensis]
MYNSEELKDKILKLKKEKNAVILAHYYQEEAIQDIADFVGDSLELSRKASQTDSEIIVFAGVHFMAETAKILNPNKKVLLPDLDAGCSLADACSADEFANFRYQYPDHLAISYINCSAEVKAMSDLICTSANAVKIIQSIPKGQPILFAPDKNLGKYLIRETGRDMLLWEGACMVHEAFSIEKIMEVWKKYPKAKLVAHPESEPHLLKVADFVGSTSAMLKFVQKDDHPSYIIATEAGILHEMQKAVPQKVLIPAPSHENNTCACSECAFMKMNSLENLYQCLKLGAPEITLDPDIQTKALLPIQKMLNIS